MTRILEIGPSDCPRHDTDGVKLNDGDQYVAVDKNSKVFESPVWRELQDQFHERVEMVTADIEKGTEFDDGSFDEIVMLGAAMKPGHSDTFPPEINRLLKVGGILKIGIGDDERLSVEPFMREWMPVFERLGYKIVSKAKHKRTIPYQKDDGQVGHYFADSIVFTLKKGN
jgi:SAM-dependent methyltransferase